jgi:hypothetical protein
LSLRRARLLALALLLLVAGRPASAHDGPPYPIVSDGAFGAYRISIWTDPDTTDDDTAGGQFWIVVSALSGRELSESPTVQLAVQPEGGAGTARETTAVADSRDRSRHFAALRLDREGRWAVRATIDGPLGRALVSSEVEATYDLRPAPALVAVYALPFVLVGILWIKALRARRRLPPPPGRSSPARSRAE